MKNCYALVRTDESGDKEVLDVLTTFDAAVKAAQTFYLDALIAGSEYVSVVEVALTPVVAEFKTTTTNEAAHRVERLENEVRTLRTLLTSLQGRVAELSALNTPQSAHTSWRDG